MGYSRHGLFEDRAAAKAFRGVSVMQTVDILFLCETNSATSLMAEALVNQRSDGSYRAFSAGSRPAGAILPEARMALSQRAIPTDGLEPKSWTIFNLPGGLKPHIVVDLATVTWTEPECAKLAEYATLRWPLRDPALVERKGERRQITEAVLGALITRINGDLFRRIDGARQAIVNSLEARPAQWA